LATEESLHTLESKEGVPHDQLDHGARTLSQVRRAPRSPGCSEDAAPVADGRRYEDSLLLDLVARCLEWWRSKRTTANQP
jgi:hypothetical protein